MNRPRSLGTARAMIDGMNHYRIHSNDGIDLGSYTATCPGGALDAMAREAGYKDQADAIAAGVAPFHGTVAIEVEPGVIGSGRYYPGTSDQ